MNRKLVYIIDNDTVTLSLYSKLIASEELEIVPIESSEIFLETFDDSIPSCAIIDLGVIYKDGTSMYNDNGIFKGIFYSKKKSVK